MSETEKDWPFPWDKVEGIYQSDGPKKPTRVEIDQVWYFVSPTGDEGIDTNRAKHFVACVDCNTILHHNTTGPSSRILSHHRAEHTADSALADDPDEDAPPLQPCKHGIWDDPLILCGMFVHTIKGKVLEPNGELHTCRSPKANEKAPSCELRLPDGARCWMSKGHAGSHRDYPTSEEEILRMPMTDPKEIKNAYRILSTNIFLEYLAALPVLTAEQIDRMPTLERWRVWTREGWQIHKWIEDPSDSLKRLDVWTWAVGENGRWMDKLDDNDLPAVGDKVTVHVGKDGDTDNMMVCEVEAVATSNFCVRLRLEGRGESELLTLWEGEKHEKWFPVKEESEVRKDGWLFGPNAYDENALTCGEKVEDGRCGLEAGHTGPHQNLFSGDERQECKYPMPGEHLCFLTKGHEGEHQDYPFSQEREAEVLRAHGHDDGPIKNISCLMKFNMGPPRIVHMRALVAAADRLQIPTEADFNGVTVLAMPGDDPESLDKNLEAALDQKEKFAMADRKQN